ncbi:phage tail domain-containing protein [Bacillus mojavensis]
MPTIKDKLYFNFNGVWSSEHKLINVVLDSGMYEEDFVASREINETEVRGSNKPLFQDVSTSPLQFEMTIAFEENFTDEDIDSIIRWLFVDYYKPLYFEGKEDRVYMCMPVDDSQIIHNGIKQGYFTITMRCDASNLYSPFILTPLETVTGTKTITIENNGHFDVYPEISLKKIGAGTITITSVDDGGEIFEIRDLTDQEDIYIDCEREIIETDIVGVYRYNNQIGEFPRLIYGQNNFKIDGDCEIQFRYKNKYKF